MNELALLLASTIASGTPLALASLGLIVNERSGVINLGAEGLMLVAAVAGFACAVSTASPVLGLLAGAAAAAVLAALLGALVIWLNTNQYASGLSVSLFGYGFSAFVGVGYTQETLAVHADSGVPGLSQIPFFGPALFTQHPLAYAAVALSLLQGWFYWRSKRGTRGARGRGLSRGGSGPRLPSAVDSVASMVAGGAIVGLAGAYVSIVATPLWVEGMIAGKGFIALALTTFATWRPRRALLGAYLFGGVTVLQLNLQGRGVNVPLELLSALPYLATIAVLVLISRSPRFIQANMPASLGKPFYPGS